MKATQKRKNGRRGFTVTRMVIVWSVPVLAMLVAFAMPTITTTSTICDRRICASMVGSGGPLAMQLALYRQHAGQFPADLRSLASRPADPTQAGSWRGPYIMDSNSLKDPWGNDMKYKAPGVHNAKTYDLWSVGPDGQDATDDDIRNWREG